MAALLKNERRDQGKTPRLRKFEDEMALLQSQFEEERLIMAALLKNECRDQGKTLPAVFIIENHTESFFHGTS